MKFQNISTNRFEPHLKKKNEWSRKDQESKITSDFLTTALDAKGKKMVANIIDLTLASLDYSECFTIHPYHNLMK